jgi:hypothetical protein
MVQVRAGRVAGNCETAFCGNFTIAAVFRTGEKTAKNDRSIGDGASEDNIAVGALFAAPFLIGECDCPCAAARIADTRSIFLREQYIEADRRDVGFYQSVDDSRHLLAGPWPTADAPNGFIVDVENADRLVKIISAWAPTLILIKDKILQIGAQRR